MSKNRTWTDEQLVQAVTSQKSLSQVLRALGLRVAGGNHKSIRHHINRLGIDTSHFNPEEVRDLALVSFRYKEQLSNSTIFCTNSTVSRNALKIRLRKLNLLPIVCALCGNQGVHNHLPLQLQIDHINGISNDNRLENLRWLCPNCHSQTPTYAGKRSKRSYRG